MLSDSWRLADGDIEKLHEDYADDVSIVNAPGAPHPWLEQLSRYLPGAASAHEAGTDGPLEYVHQVSGTVSWRVTVGFAALWMASRMIAGHTTVVLEKRSNRWLSCTTHFARIAPPRKLLR